MEKCHSEEPRQDKTCPTHQKGLPNENVCGGTEYIDYESTCLRHGIASETQSAALTIDAKNDASPLQPPDSSPELRPEIAPKDATMKPETVSSSQYGALSTELESPNLSKDVANLQHEGGTTSENNNFTIGSQSHPTKGIVSAGQPINSSLDLSFDRHSDPRRPRPTNENPNFVRDYFASSRLHFIGSFRARYESMMGTVAAKLKVDPAALLFPPPIAGAATSSGAERVIVHVDMDCFFASVAVAADPSLKGRPIAVCHGRGHGAGSGEISSCSYEARSFGVRASMFFSRGKELCPDLVGVPYDFAAYERASIAMYARFFAIPGAIVEAMSVDEAYLDLTHAAEGADADALVRELRSNILADTGCTASAGIATCKLVARLATKRAKPDGQLRVCAADAPEFVAALPVRELPGVGGRTAMRFSELGVGTCRQLLAVPLRSLQTEFGERQGKIFFDVVRGRDERPVEPMKPRKSIGAEASWGVRFDGSPEEHLKCVKFIDDMAAEVAARVVAAGAIGTKVLYKAYRMRKEAKPMKYLGHGSCDILTRSAKITDKVDKESLAAVMAAVCQKIHRSLGIHNNELRGVGVQLTDLLFENLKLPAEWRPGDSSATSKIDSFLKHSPGRNLFNSQLPSVKKRSMQEFAGSIPKRSRLFFSGSKSRSDDGTIHADLAQSAADEANPDADEATASAREIPEDWDASVFMALPEDIRKELISAQRGRSISRDSGASSRGGGASGTEARVVEKNAKPKQRKLNSEQSPKQPRRSFFVPKKAKPNEAAINGELPRPFSKDIEPVADKASTPSRASAPEIPKDWDPSVFMALPEDIRKELMSVQGGRHAQSRSVAGSSQKPNGSTSVDEGKRKSTLSQSNEAQFAFKKSAAVVSKKPEDQGASPFASQSEQETESTPNANIGNSQSPVIESNIDPDDADAFIDSDGDVDFGSFLKAGGK